MRAATHVVVAFFLAGTLAACGITSPSDLIAEPPYTGTVLPGSVSVNTLIFSTTKTGEFIVKVDSVSPDTGATIGIQYGQPSNGLCGLISQNPISGQGRTAFDLQLPKGAYCLQVYDSGFLVHTESFSISVSHS
jgi:hypothetical protein